MGKKRSRASQTSKGERRNVAKSVRKAMSRDYRANGFGVMTNKIDAWLAGKRVMVTVPNTGKDNKKAPFIRIPASEAWGDPRRKYTMKQSSE